MFHESRKMLLRQHRYVKAFGFCLMIKTLVNFTLKITLTAQRKELRIMRLEIYSRHRKIMDRSKFTHQRDTGKRKNKSYRGENLV